MHCRHSHPAFACRPSSSAVAPAVCPRPRRRDPVWFRPSFVALTPAARSSLDLADVPLARLLDRHERGDWGCVSPDTARDNEWALRHHDSLWSMFELPTGVRLVLVTDPTHTITSGLVEAEPAAPLRQSHPLHRIHLPIST